MNIEETVQGKIDMPKVKRIDVEFRPIKPGEKPDGIILGKPVRAVYILDKEAKKDLEGKKDKDERIKEILEKAEIREG